MNIPNIQVSPDIVPSEDAATFASQVQSEAYRIAKEQADSGYPNEKDVRTLIPYVRLQLQARRQKSFMDRIAGGIKARLDSILGEQAQAERDVQNLFALQRQKEEMLASHKRALEKLSFVDGVEGSIRDSIVAVKRDIPAWYTGDMGSGPGGDCASNVIAAYRHIAAAEMALADFADVRAGFLTAISKIEDSIAAFDAKHADILGG